MNKKIKKILTTTILSAMTATAIGCSTNGNKLAKDIDKSMAQFVTSVNKLDYVETTKPTNEKIGKIVETNAPYYNNNSQNIDSHIKYLNSTIANSEIENTITKPSDRTDDFKLFILSDMPFVSLTSDDAKANISVKVKFSTDKIQETSSEIDEKINKLILKRSILLIYVNEIYNGNVNLSDEDKTAINAYVNVIKENASFLNGNRGMVKNQLKLASDLVEKNSNDNLVNYYIIKSGEALETRASKFDSTISAIDSITEIIENNLSPSSTYYNTKLSGTYDNIFSNQNTSENSEITNTSSNQEIAGTLTNVLSSIFPCDNKKIDTNKNAENGIMTLPLINNETKVQNTPENTNRTTIRRQQSGSNQNSNNRNLNGIERQNNKIGNTVNSTNNVYPRINEKQNLNDNTQNLQNSANLNRNFTNNRTNLQNSSKSDFSNDGLNLSGNTAGRNSNSNTRKVKTVTRRNNMNPRTNQNTIRAERVPERVTTEDNAKTNLLDENRAIKVPYIANR